MSGIFGALNLTDSDRSYINTLGQGVVYEAAKKLLDEYNQSLQAAMSVFVERETPDYKLRYKLAGGGRLQRRGGQAQSGAVKAGGKWDIGLPLEDFGAQLASDDVAIAYMTIDEFDRHLDTILIQDTNTVRYEILKALFNNTQRTFVDPLYGSLAIEPLANGDAVLYPPVVGSESEGTEDHYIETNYAAASINDTNNPIVTAVDELEEHFGGGTQGGSNIVVFINKAHSAKIRALADFTPIEQRFITAGDGSVADKNLPNVPGKIIGYCNGAWVSVWYWIPVNYLVAVHLEAPAPLLMRVDPAETGLGTGLQLVIEDQDYPFKVSHYRHRFGVGAGNRLNAVVLEFGTGGTYSVPAAYS